MANDKSRVLVHRMGKPKTYDDLEELAATNLAQTSGGTAANSITVSGVGQVSYSPNEALVSVSVITSATTAEGATTSNAEATTKVIKALNSIGIDNSSMQTQGYY